PLELLHPGTESPSVPPDDAPRGRTGLAAQDHHFVAVFVESARQDRSHLSTAAGDHNLHHASPNAALSLNPMLSNRSTAAARTGVKTRNRESLISRTIRSLARASNRIVRVCLAERSWTQKRMTPI